MMVSGDKAKVERYLNERYGGTFEVIVPGDPISSRSHGSVLKFPVWAYNTEDPDVLFEVSRNKVGESHYKDYYPIVLLEKQLEELLNTALAEAGILAASDVVMYFEGVDNTTVPLGENLQNYLSSASIEKAGILLDIAIFDIGLGVEELDEKLTQIFLQMDEFFDGKEHIAYGFVLVKTDNFEEFAHEVHRYGIEQYVDFDNAEIINFPSAAEGGSFTHDGFRRPLRESLEVLLGEKIHG
jgi:hypothetical protein